jgi:hypothetical protein
MAPRPRTPDTRQLDFEGYFAPARPAEASPGAMNFDAELRGALKLAMKQSASDRDDVAAAMTMMLGGEGDEPGAGDEFRVTRAQLDAFTAASKSAWKMPVTYLPAFIKATGAVWLLDMIAGKCGCRVLVGEEAVLAQWGALELQEQRLKAEKKRLQRALPPAMIDRLIRNRGGAGE